MANWQANSRVLFLFWPRRRAPALQARKLEDTTDLVQPQPGMQRVSIDPGGSQIRARPNWTMDFSRERGCWKQSSKTSVQTKPRRCRQSFGGDALSVFSAKRGPRLEIKRADVRCDASARTARKTRRGKPSPRIMMQERGEKLSLQVVPHQAETREGSAKQHYGGAIVRR